MKFIRNVLIALAVLAVLAVVGGLIAESVIASRTLDPILESTAANMQKAWPKIEADVEHLQKHSFFRAREGGDAGVWLNKQLSWRGKDPVDGPLQKAWEAADEKVRKLAEEDLNPARTLDDETAAALRALDLAWMKDLGKYGHWSTMSDSPRARMNPVRIASAPMPDYLTLLRWSKVRLYRGILDDELETATTEVLHLAHLCLSTEGLVGAMVGVSLTRVVHTMNPEGPIQQQDHEAMKRLFYGAPAFATWAAPSAERKRFADLAREKLPIARCVAWSEGALHYTMDPFLRDRFSEFYDELDAQAPNKDGCRLGFLEKVRQAVRADPYLLLKSDVDDAETGENASALAKVPIVRGIVGVTLASIASPAWLKNYE